MKRKPIKLILPFLIGALLLGLLAMINVLALSLEDQFALRVDMTEKELYTLSEESENVIDNLTQNVSIYAVYFRGNEDAHVLNVLAKYVAASDKIFVQNVDPFTNPTFLTQFGNTSLSSQEGAVIVTNADGSSYRIIPNNEMYEVDEWGNLYETNVEQKITSAMDVVTSGTGKRVRLLTGHKEMELATLEELTDSLEAVNFDVSSIDIISENPNAEKDILVCISPKSDFTPEERVLIERFISQGGTFVLLMDSVIFDKTEGAVQVLEEPRDNIHGLLKTYGLSIGQNLVVGQNPEAISLRPTTFKVELAPHEITSEILQENKSVVLSEASTIYIDESADVQPLLLAPTDSFAKSLSNMTNLFYSSEDETGEFALGAISTNVGNLVLFSSSSFVTNEEIQISGNNELLSAVCTYASPEMSVLNIPRKSLQSTRITVSDEFSQMLLGIFLDILLPAAIVLAGVKITLNRKKI